MAIITTQTIPAALLKLYEAALGKARQWKTQENVRHRYPWRIKYMQGDGRITKDADLGVGVSQAQFEHRKFFRRSCDCYNLQDPSHAILNPPYGPKSRGYWFDQAIGSGLWYYDYFMQQTINAYIASGTPLYCRGLVTADAWVEELAPDANYGTSWNLYASNDNINNREIYVTKNDPLKNIWHFIVKSVGTFGVGWDKVMYLDFYAVNEVINELGITWNNKPALGEKIGVIGLVETDTNKWFEMYIPNIKAFAVLVRPRVVLQPFQWLMASRSREDQPVDEEFAYWT